MTTDNKNNSNKYKNGILNETISSSLITKYIIMMVIMMIFAGAIYGFTREWIGNGRITGSEALMVFIAFFLGVYLLLLVLFVLIISNQLNKPLNLLRDAIENFDINENPHIEYSGPREFEEIVDSFNSMSERLSESTKENARLTEEKNKMLADISHDLKTPITVIQGYAAALHDGLIKEEQIPDYLNIINQKSASVAYLINQFYEYSKLEHPDYNFEMKKLNIAEYIRELLVNRIDELYVNGYELEVNIPDNMTAYIMANDMELKRVFENLISNTIAHTPKGTLLSFDMGIEDGNVLIRYQDNGGGIDEEVATRIFEPFVVEDSARHKSGSGLGLSIAKKIVEVHGGSIILERNTPRIVTSYLISLPLCED